MRPAVRPSEVDVGHEQRCMVLGTGFSFEVVNADD
jgi:hypothetical protein